MRPPEKAALAENGNKARSSSSDSQGKDDSRGADRPRKEGSRARPAASASVGPFTRPSTSSQLPGASVRRGAWRASGTFGRGHEAARPAKVSAMDMISSSSSSSDSRPGSAFSPPNSFSGDSSRRDSLSRSSVLEDEVTAPTPSALFEESPTKPDKAGVFFPPTPAHHPRHLSSRPAHAFDWATFTHAYARGNWDPNRMPYPPQFSSLATTPLAEDVKACDPGSIPPAPPALSSLHLSSSDEPSSTPVPPEVSYFARPIAPQAFDQDGRSVISTPMIPSMPTPVSGVETALASFESFNTVLTHTPGQERGQTHTPGDFPWRPGLPDPQNELLVDEAITASSALSRRATLPPIGSPSMLGQPPLADIVTSSSDAAAAYAAIHGAQIKPVGPSSPPQQLSASSTSSDLTRAPKGTAVLRSPSSSRSTPELFPWSDTSGAAPGSSGALPSRPHPIIEASQPTPGEGKDEVKGDDLGDYFGFPYHERAASRPGDSSGRIITDSASSSAAGRETYEGGRGSDRNSASPAPSSSTEKTCSAKDLNDPTPMTTPHSSALGILSANSRSSLGGSGSDSLGEEVPTGATVSVESARACDEKRTELQAASDGERSSTADGSLPSLPSRPEPTPVQSAEPLVPASTPSSSGSLSAPTLHTINTTYSSPPRLSERAFSAGGKVEDQRIDAALEAFSTQFPPKERCEEEARRTTGDVNAETIARSLEDKQLRQDVEWPMPSEFGDARMSTTHSLSFPGNAPKSGFSLQSPPLQPASSGSIVKVPATTSVSEPPEDKLTTVLSQSGSSASSSSAIAASTASAPATDEKRDPVSASLARSMTTDATHMPSTAGGGGTAVPSTLGKRRIETRPAPGGPSTSPFTSGRKAEEFFLRHGFLPAPHPPNEAERKKALNRFGILNTARDVNFDRIAHLAKLVFQTKIVLISLIDEDTQWFKSESGTSTEEAKRIQKDRDVSFCAHAILQQGGEPLVVLDATKDWRFAKNPLVKSGLQIRFYAGAPLRTSDGFNIGSLCVMDDRPRTEFNPRQRHTLKEFASIVMREMELWKDKIHLRMRDRMQASIERFTRECLAMEWADDETGNLPSSRSSGLQNIYDSAAKLIRTTLDIDGALVLDLSSFEVIDTVDADGTRASKVYYPSPFQTEVTPNFPPFVSPSTTPDEYFEAVPPVAVLGSSEVGTPPPERKAPVPLTNHMRLAEFLRHYPGGHYYQYIPPHLRHIFPRGTTCAIAVPVFSLNKQPFALLCAYIKDVDRRPLEGYELSYLRSIGIIILSAVLKKDLISADKAKSLFISNISHELRTPLHGILAAGELLSETKLDATQKSYLETVEACGNSLLELVNHVLDFTKLSGGTQTGVPPVGSVVKCDLVRLVSEVCESSFIGQVAKIMHSQQAAIGSVYSPPADLEVGGGDGSAKALSARGGLKSATPLMNVETIVDVSMRKNGWLVRCDTGGVRRVLMNLIGNSLKFTSEGYVQVSLREVQGGSDRTVMVEMAVTDTGKGISRHFLETQLFHPFTQENPLGTGTGLGLSIVNSIVQSPAFGGKIDVWSTEGQGTEIRITCEMEVFDESGLEGEVYKPQIDVAGSKAVTLLGFSDTHKGESALRDVLKGYFGSWFHFQIREDLSEPSDIILINEKLDILQGLTARKDVSRPVIFFTGARGYPSVAKACEAHFSAGGMARTLFKPGGPAKLEAVVDFCLQYIDRRRAGLPADRNEIKPSTPLPSPSGSLLYDSGDLEGYFTDADIEKIRRAGNSTDNGSPGQADAAHADITPTGRHPSSRASSSMAGPVSPLSPHLTRRHSTEEGRLQEARSRTPVRPMMPARSITYHHPSLHKHVMMSPLSNAGSGASPSSGGIISSTLAENRGFASAVGAEQANTPPLRPPSGQGSTPSTPGSTVSIGAGEGRMLKTAVKSINIEKNSSLPSGSNPSKRKLRVLTVEDNVINRRVLQAFLKKMDVEFVEACDGAEGVKTFDRFPPNYFDVVLMDLSMPVLDGIAATVEIRKIELKRMQDSQKASRRLSSSVLPSTSSSARSSKSTSPTSTRFSRSISTSRRSTTPVTGDSNPTNLRGPSLTRAKIFALTGRSSPEDKRRAFASGFDGFCQKPMSLATLASLLSSLQINA